MTREEAKEYIFECLDHDEATEIIKALCPEPCEDAVSRVEVINGLQKICDECDSEFCGDCRIDTEGTSLDSAKEMLKRLPPVTPTHTETVTEFADRCVECGNRYGRLLKQVTWIPVSERLPEEMGTYMTTIDYGEHGLVTGQRYYYGRGLKWNDECVIAWMPLPEPYNTEMECEE